jgi:hypothetical protein
MTDIDVSCRRSSLPSQADGIAYMGPPRGCSQEKDGGWKYVAGGTSSSFQTAAVTLALLDARHAGFEVSEDTVKRAAGCLEALREENGAFRYEGRTSAPMNGPKGACGRSVACELALLMAGKGDRGRLRTAVETFLKHRHELERVRAGRDYDAATWKGSHWGPEGIAAYYSPFGHLYAVQALHALGDGGKVQAGERARSPAECVELIAAEVAKIQNADGSWEEVDITHATRKQTRRPLLSDTAMALVTLAGAKLVLAPPP